MPTLPPTRDWLRHDYYAVLGVDPDAPPEVVDAAYRRLARRWHPDRNPGDREAEERTKALIAAYTVLRDPVTRTAYDALRRRPTAAPGPAGPLDHLAPPRRPRPHRPLPTWARRTIAMGLAALGGAVGAWAAVGSLPAPGDADTPVMVRATLGIAAAKLLSSAVLVAAYARLRDRFAR